jgi:hypothetical protein
MRKNWPFILPKPWQHDLYQLRYVRILRPHNVCTACVLEPTYLSYPIRAFKYNHNWQQARNIGVETALVLQGSLEEATSIEPKLGAHAFAGHYRYD